jgi:mono/diheme cytochrome c family protein
MKHFSSIWIIFLVFLFALSILSAEKGDAAKGKELFESRCAGCHGSTGEGNKAIGDLYKIKMPVLSSKEVQSIDDAALGKIVLEGKGKMKPVGLSSQEIANVIAFLRTLKK